MLARTLFSRLYVSQTLCSPVIQQCSRVIPFTCRTTSMMRQISCSTCQFQEDDDSKKVSKTTRDPKKEGCNGYIPRQVDADLSIQYMNSEAYLDVYKDEPVWAQYRKNTKGSFYPPIRKTCIRNGVITTGSACPICRDDYLVFDYRNVKLLKQFLSDVTGEPLDIRNTGLCRRQFRTLQLELAKAQDYGILQKSFPLRWYNYQYYYDLVRSRNRSRKSIESKTSSQDPRKQPVEQS